MREYKISNHGSGQVFKNPVMEWLTRTHFLFPVILYFSLAGVCIAYAIFFTELKIWKLVYMFPLGLLTFTLVEYLIHRFLFHFEAKTEKQQKLKYSIHGVHHEFPKDKDRLVMPPVLSVVLAVLFFYFFKLIADNYVWLFYPGFLAGYSTYLLIHYSVHRYRPPRNFLKYLWKHHSLHHYKSEDMAFSVSFPLWDHVFGTMPALKKNDRVAQDKLPDYN
jgi:4-hydroxysphinganine ceramide fatty acyl 2-hydroxylase